MANKKTPTKKKKVTKAKNPPVKKMTKQDSQEIWEGRNKLFSLTGKILGCSVSRNLRSIKGEMEDLNSQNIPSEEFIDYEKARIELCKKYSDKDRDKNPVMYDDKDGVPQYQITNMPKFRAALNELQDEHKEAIDANNASIDEYNELLKQPSSVSMRMISRDLIPEDATVEQIDIMYFMLTE